MEPAKTEPLTQLAVESAEQSNDPHALARAVYNRALILQELKRIEEAELLHHRVYSILESAKASDASLAMALQSLANFYFVTNRPAQAEPLLLRAANFPIREKFPLVMAIILNSLGEVQFALGQDRKAEATFRRALSFHSAITPVPTDDEFHYVLFHGEERERLLALILNNQGVAAYRLGQLKQAEKCWRQSLQLYKSLPGRGGAMASPTANLGELLRFQKRYTEAAEHLADALSLFETTFGPESVRVGLVLNLLGNTLYETGDLRQVRRLYERALGIFAKLGKDQGTETGVILSNFAELEVREGNTARAREAYERSLVIMERTLGPQHPLLVTTLLGQAALYRKLGQRREAKAVEKRTHAILAGAARPGMVSLEDLQRGR